MIKVNKKIEYAMMALKYLAEKANSQPEKLISAREICDQFQTPFDTMAKVLQSLNNHDIVQSTKGIKGGYVLARSLSSITFQELSDFIDGNEQESFCISKKGKCDLYDHCNIVTPIDNLNRLVSEFLSELTLEQLLIDKRVILEQA